MCLSLCLEGPFVHANLAIHTPPLCTRVKVGPFVNPSFLPVLSQLLLLAHL